ncbi:hypothetical protein [Cellulomonas xylanilytica]|uniref:Lipoprotein n=1 Tax=Cellulomonas xylanilytica TaxID=233583 RepID=A0A510V253_9CELL|nr:hypothetical protein [Cellulomonas xylanilytica]GEK19911.1 hypothetical protein CXY01_04310 [Cellulomonas xylanilytica]
MRNRQITKGAATATALIVVAALLGACTDPAPTPTPAPSATPSTSTPTPSPTPSVDPTIAQAEAAILEAYQGYWDAKVAAFANPTKDPGPELERFAVDKAFSDVGTALFTFRDSGIAFTGAPSLNPTVSNIVIGELGSATITDCVDSTEWQPVYTATGESAAAPGQAMTALTNSTAYWYLDHWTIRTSDVDRGTPCDG